MSAVFGAADSPTRGGSTNRNPPQTRDRNGVSVTIHRAAADRIAALLLRAVWTERPTLLCSVSRLRPMRPHAMEMQGFDARRIYLSLQAKQFERRQEQ